MCENTHHKDFQKQLIKSVAINFSLNFFPSMITDYLKLSALINQDKDYLCKQIVAISMLYFIKKNFYELCEVVFLFQMTSLLSYWMISKGYNDYLSNKLGELLRLYVRFHSHLESPTGICIILASILASQIANSAEKQLMNYYRR